MEISDEKIIEYCQKGELERFGALYEKYIKKIYAFVYCKIQHKESAEDLCAKTFLKALNKIGEYKSGQGTFQAWLYRIARNNVIDYYRTKRAESDIEDVWGLGDNKNAERDLDMKMRLESVEEYLLRLDAKQRELIIMRVWQGLSFREISEICGKSSSACKVAYARAIGQLRKSMPLAKYLFLLFTKI